MQPKKTTTSMAQATAGTTTTRKNARPPWGHYGIGWLTVRPRWQGLRLPCHRFHKSFDKSHWCFFTSGHSEARQECADAVVVGGLCTHAGPSRRQGRRSFTNHTVSPRYTCVKVPLPQTSCTISELPTCMHALHFRHVLLTSTLRPYYIRICFTVHAHGGTIRLKGHGGPNAPSCRSWLTAL